MANKKIKLFVACSDGWDGSVSATLFNTKKEALEELNRSEEELENGTFYDDGMIIEVKAEITVEGKLAKPIRLNIE